MKDSILERIRLVKESEDRESLIKYLCPFYEKGGHPDCIGCKKLMGQLEECKKVYLSRIEKYPMDIWDESFDAYEIEKRDNKIPMGEADGMGIHCDSCYMFDKCPYYKKGYDCAIAWDSSVPDTPEEMYDFLLTTQFERVRRAKVFEKIDGGVPDEGLSKEMDRLHSLVEGKANLSREGLSIRLNATGSVDSGGEGILSKIFGGGSSRSLEVREERTLSEKASSVEDIEPIGEVEKPEKVLGNENSKKINRSLSKKIPES